MDMSPIAQKTENETYLQRRDEGRMTKAAVIAFKFQGLKFVGFPT